MFTHLVESSPDTSGFRRRSTFFLGTVASYSLILFAAGIVGILTYEAHVEAQTTEIQIDWLPLAERAPEADRPREPATARPKQLANVPVDPTINEAMRTSTETTTDDPRAVPKNVGVKGSGAPPWTGTVRLGPRNANPPPVGPNLTGCVVCGDGPPKVAETDAGGLPPKPPKPETLRVTSVVISSKIIALPKPVYPEAAKRIRIQGPVNVQILIDESGKVISAQAVKGNGLLATAAENAARRATFTPTKLGGQPVKVQGVITYNFVLQ